MAKAKFDKDNFIMNKLLLFLTLLISKETFSNDLNIFVISDLNGRYGSTHYSEDVRKSIEYIIKEKPDLVLSGGDHVAGQKAGLNYQAMWDSFHEYVTLPLSKNSIPFFPTPGNHDASTYNAFKKEREIYKKNFTIPKGEINKVDIKNFPLNYAFSLKNTLFISLDATGLKLGPTQISWLEDLLKKQREKYKWVIFFGHVPLIPVAVNRENDYLRDRELFNLLKRHDVSLWISGHHHAYYPGKKDGVKFVSLSCLGGGSRKLIGDTKISKKGILKIKITSTAIQVEGLDSRNNFLRIKKEALPVSIGKNQHLLERD